MATPFGDLTREVKEIREVVDQPLARVPERGLFIFGPEVEIFDESLAQRQ